MLLGLLLALLGTLCFSCGNMLSSHMQGMGLTPWLTNTWAMMIGAAILTLGSLAIGLKFALPFHLALHMEEGQRYIAALLYLAIPGSVIGFTAYLMLVGRMGPQRAAYCTVLFPVVALGVSTVYEGYQWASLSLLGLFLVLIGNLLVFIKMPTKGSATSEAN